MGGSTSSLAGGGLRPADKIPELPEGTDLGRPFVDKLDTLVDVLRKRSLYQPNKVAYNFIDDKGKAEESITYGQLDSAAAAIAERIVREGCAGQEHRVLLLFPPGKDLVSAFFGVLYAGAVAVLTFPPDPSRLKRDLPRLERIVQDGAPSIAFTSKQIYMYMKAKIPLGKLSSIEKEGKPSWKVKWISGLPKPWNGPSEAFFAHRSSQASGGSRKEAEAGRHEGMAPSCIGGDCIAFLQYSSGSTGTPKGVMLTHKNLLYNSHLIGVGFATSTNDIGVIWLPPYHDMGLIGGILQPLYAGFPVYLLSPLTFLRRPMLWLQTISHFKATISGGPNFSYDLCVRKSTEAERKALNLSSWKVAFSGSEPVWEKTLTTFTDAFAVSGFKMEMFYPCYGLAESTLIVTGGAQDMAPTIIDCPLHKPREGEPQRRRVSCGWVLDDRMEIKIVDPDTCQEKQESEEGEIWVFSPSNAPGYWNMPEETKETFDAHLAGAGSEKAYTRTGDLGYIKDKELYISGRMKDLIIIRGRNHYPQDIEKTIETTHAEIRPGCCATFSIETENEEQLAMVAELREEVKVDKLDHEAFLKSIRSSVAQNHSVHLHTIAFLKARTIPKTTSGKIRRRVVKELLEEDKFGKDLILRDVSKAGSRARGGATERGEASAEGGASAGAEGATRGNLSREEIMGLPSKEEKIDRITQFIMEQVADLLGTSTQDPHLKSDAPLVNLGLDSMMIADVKGGLEYDLRMTIPPEALAVGEGPTARSLAKEALKAMEREDEAEETPEAKED